METQFRIAVERRGPLAHVTPQGELDLQVAELLEELVEGALEDGARTVVVDLGQLSFMDSTGLCALVNCREEARRVGAILHVHNVLPTPRRIFEITNLEDLLCTCELGLPEA